MNNISYRKATLDDIQTTTEIALLLFDEHTYDEMYEDSSKVIAKDSAAIFLAFDGEKTVGFSHCSLRHDYVEGTHGGIIGYLEGVYVLPEYRKQGVAKTLVAICEKWAKDKGCLEFASDCQLNNFDSYNFHIRIGFQDVNRMICFVKNL